MCVQANFPRNGGLPGRARGDMGLAAKLQGGTRNSYLPTSSVYKTSASNPAFLKSPRLNVSSPDIKIRNHGSYELCSFWRTSMKLQLPKYLPPLSLISKVVGGEAWRRRSSCEKWHRNTAPVNLFQIKLIFCLNRLVDPLLQTTAGACEDKLPPPPPGERRLQWC